MTITYDKWSDVLYIRFKTVTVATKHFADGIVTDYDAGGSLVAIEVVDAMKRLGDAATLGQVTLAGAAGAARR